MLPVRRHLVGLGCMLAACTAAQPDAGESVPPSGLAGTSWRLVYFQSSSDAIGTIRPEDPDRYAMSLDADGTVSMQLDCNRASGTWSSGAAGDGSGSFAFGPLALTSASCPESPLGARVARDVEYVRSYVLRDGRLYLNLFADGGTYAWERVP